MRDYYSSEITGEPNSTTTDSCRSEWVLLDVVQGVDRGHLGLPMRFYELAGDDPVSLANAAYSSKSAVGL